MASSAVAAWAIFGEHGRLAAVKLQDVPAVDEAHDVAAVVRDGQVLDALLLHQEQRFVDLGVAGIVMTDSRMTERTGSLGRPSPATIRARRIRSVTMPAGPSRSPRTRAASASWAVMRAAAWRMGVSGKQKVAGWQSRSTGSCR